ncbi:head-tail connector protein [Halocynthiibacter sp.]|uniref:head-tail connector protein n=1 Tax=Halocynthiibacter sp. TaxID=1979210 RepID=UPI003C517D3F
MMLIEQTTIPTLSLPLAEFRDHLRLGTGFADDAVQDGVLERALRAALAMIETRTGKILLTRDFIWRITGWRDQSCQALPVAPVSALINLQIVDRTGDVTVIDPAQYRLQEDDFRPRLVATGGYLPAIPAAGEAEIGFQAGFGASWGDMPADIAQAVFMLAANLYENRDGMDESCLPAGVEMLISRYRTVRTIGGVK